MRITRYACAYTQNRHVNEPLHMLETIQEGLDGGSGIHYSLKI